MALTQYILSHISQGGSHWYNTSQHTDMTRATRRHTHDDPGPQGSGLKSRGPWLTARWAPEPEAGAWRVHQGPQELGFVGGRELGTGLPLLFPSSLSHSFLPGPQASAREWATQAPSGEEWC